MEIDVEDYYRQYGPMVLRRCRFILKDEDRALEAMQDVFVRLLEKRRKLKHSYPSSLLYRIATNVCLNIIRSEKKRFVDGDDMLHTIASRDGIENRIEAEEMIERIFQNEKESTRDMAFMHYVDGLTLQEVADEAGLSVSGVRKRLRTLKSRAHNMKEEHDG